jgi:hypothetical protein
VSLKVNLNRPLLWVIVFLLTYQILILSIIHITAIEPQEYSKKALSIIHYWKTHTFSQHKFVPAYTHKLSSTISYLSHPPLSYYSLYGFNSIFGFKSYYIFNSLLVVISAFFIYLTICLLTLKQAKSELSLFAWIGMILYLTSYPILNYQILNYHPDIFVFPFLIISQYIFLKLLMKERYRSAKYLFLIGLFLAIMSYSSWFGVVFNFTIILIALINLRKGYRLFPYIIIAILVTASITLLIYGQYSLVGGWKNVFYYFKDTYLRESPFYGHLRQSGFEILIQMVKSLGVLFSVLITLIFYSFLAKKRKFIFTKNGYKYLILSVIPVLMYSVLLVHYFQNPFASLYFVPPLVVCISIWLEKLYKASEARPALLKIVGLIVLTNLSLLLFF